jgi:hypothetical protein
MKPTLDLSNKTKAELTALARRKKIPVTSGMLKSELITAIKKGLRKIEAQKKTQAKTTRKSTARKTTTARRKKTPAKKTTRKKSTVKKSAKKATPKKPAARKPKTARSAKTVKIRTRSKPAATALPERYNDHRLVVLARDPNWAYAYWDLNPSRVRDLLKSANQTPDKARWVLRVYSAELPPEKEQGHFFDINIDVKTGSYYLDLSRPGARFIVEIGVIDASGLFRATAQSNPVILPTEHPSKTIAPEGTAASEAPDSPDRSN